MRKHESVVDRLRASDRKNLLVIRVAQFYGMRHINITEQKDQESLALPDFLTQPIEQSMEQIAREVAGTFASQGRRLDGIVIDVPGRRGLGRETEDLPAIRRKVVDLVRQIRQNDLRDDAYPGKIPPETMDGTVPIIIKGSYKTPVQMQMELDRNANDDITGNILIVDANRKSARQDIINFIDGKESQRGIF